MFRFLHAADIHLDSPLRGLEVYQDAPIEQIRSAVRRAFDNLVDLAIQEETAFVLLSGDLFDGDWKDYNTGIYFNSRMGLLREAGIRVFIVSGNHDAASRITHALHLPDNVTLFSSRVAETRVRHLRHSRRLEIREPLKAVEKPGATSKVAVIYLNKFS